MSNAEKIFIEHAEDLRQFFHSNKVTLNVTSAEYAQVGMYYIDSNDNDAILIGESIIKRSPKHALIVLLHELGHYLAEKHGLYEQRRNIKMEECLAWVMAEAVLTELDWPITRAHFNSTRKRALKSYGIRS